jgi:hypothetical protein
VVPVGVAEEDEGVPAAAPAVDSVGGFVVLDPADLDALLNQPGAVDWTTRISSPTRLSWSTTSSSP